jgi:hypothetical protein
MRKFLTAVMFAAACFAALPASAQNVRVDGIALTRGGMPAPGANVAVCGQPASTTTAPCTPPANLCATLTDTLCGTANPVQADGLGNYHFYIAAGTVYTLQIYGSGLTTRVQPDQQAGGGGGGGSGVTCGTSRAVVFLSAIGQIAICDPNATLDGNGNLSLVSINASGDITAQGNVSGNKLSTNGSGGILDLQFQTPPATVPLNHGYVIANSQTGLLDCFVGVVSPTHCLSSVQIIASGSTVLPATLVAANNGCNVYSSTATGATSSNAAWTSLHGVDSSAVSGYGPGQLLVYPPFVGTNLISFKVCNPTTSNITPASLTIFWDIK